MRTPKDRQPLNPAPRNCLGAPRKRAVFATRRAAMCLEGVSLWGWPSRGGLIVLSYVSTLDFIFLGIDAADVSSYSERNPDQGLEDAFCKRLLLLGAKWFDSYDRFCFICGVEEELDVDIGALEQGDRPAPTRMERRWVSVAWLPDDKGFWIAEFETIMRGWKEQENFPPDGAARAALAQDMEQKTAILKQLGGKFFERLDGYDGAACLNAWKAKETGEVGPLEYFPHGGLIRYEY